MATLMLIRKMENQASMWLLRKALDERSQVSTPHVGKMFDAPPALSKTARKALGTVNRATEKSITEKTVKAKSSVPASDDTYPEIENFFPFDPLDFESFDLPEEHQIAHLPLNGVPLMILGEERELEQLIHVGPPSPLKIILSTLDVELPAVCCDLDI
ncbi:hypothetical protein FD754_017328 [Muntiacus muntjak]|uniref:Securin n=1 Tax=Muntiacus muntjak TaxID=9888 RepID=A0A5N3VT99_MUNMU|nr:hypothetical protein FD754_017328 [Muntiacus muntjak]